MMRFTFLLLCFGLVLSSRGEAQDHYAYILDLTRPNISPAQEEASGWGGGIGSSGPRPEIPLSIGLQSVDKRTCTYGVNSIVYEIWLKNVGGRPLEIPWSPRRAIVYRPNLLTNPAKVRLSGLEAYLGLCITNKDRQSIDVAIQGLFGDLSEPNTYRVLAPTETALVRVTNLIEFSAGNNHETKFLSGSPERVEVRAFLDLMDHTHRMYYKRISSADGIVILIRKSGAENAPKP